MTNWRQILAWQVLPETVSFEEFPSVVKPYQVWRNARGRFLCIGSEAGIEHSEIDTYKVDTGVWADHPDPLGEFDEDMIEHGGKVHVVDTTFPLTLIHDNWKEEYQEITSSLKLGWRQEEAPEEDGVGTIIASPELLSSIGLPEELSGKRYVVFDVHYRVRFRKDMPQYRGVIRVSSTNILSLYDFPYSHWYQFLQPG